MRILTVPVKALAHGKSRLAPALAPLERAALSLAMLEDVLDPAQAQPGWDVWVVSPDDAVLEIAARRGVRAIADHGDTLLRAVHRVDDEATERGADALAVVLGDLPLLTSDALSAALRTVGPVVLARSKDGAGTNLLLRRPPRAIRPRFGANSFAAHREEAEGKGLPIAVVDAPELAFDLDAPDDILRLLERSGTGRTLAVCTELELGPRLRVGT